VKLDCNIHVPKGYVFVVVLGLTTRLEQYKIPLYNLKTRKSYYEIYCICFLTLW